MAKTSRFEELLKTCKSIREIFEIQTCLAENLSAEEVLQLRAKYAGFTIEEARSYRDALAVIKQLEAKPEKTNLDEMHTSIINMIAR